MKKILLMAAVLLSTAGAFAQHEVGSFNIQPKVGLNIANVTGDDDSDPRFGFVGGAELEYQATDIFSVTGGVLYSMQGAKYDHYTEKLDYINIPILANVYVAKGFAVKLGIQPGFNVNSKGNIEKSGISIEKSTDANSVDFSIPVGLSYEFSNFQLDARYNWGLTKNYEGVDSKNSVFQITLGYKIDL